jgi:fructuronate reductase
VVTEPFSEWALSDDFPSGRPAWDAAGAVFTDDVTRYEERKLWLLNGAHSVLAYTGPLRGHATVADAVADPACRETVQQWWDTCAPYLRLSAAEVVDYRAALLERFANPRIRHALGQIATDGSQKLPVRFLPVLAQERAAGRMPGAVVAVLAAWVRHVRSAGAAVADVRSGELHALAGGPVADAVPRLLAVLSAGLADDAELVGAVRTEVGASR